VARIALVSADNLTPDQRVVYERVVSGPRTAIVGPLRAALHSPELAERWQQLGALLRYGTSLPPRIKELVILATARRWNTPLEWHVHETAARAAGLTEQAIEAIRQAQPPVLDDADEATAYEFVRELQDTGRVSSSVYDSAHRRFGTVGVVELTALIGYYTMVAMTLNAHEIRMPDDADRDALPAAGASLTELAPCSVRFDA
jgi:4-carboxymuconolactone decarboxylase